MTVREPEYNLDRLLFRRQFILGPRFVEGFPTWKRTAVRPRVRLTVHPDLPTYQARHEDLSIVLLGYMLDPDRTLDTDADIISRLLSHVEAGETLEELIRRTYPLGGRWILIADSGRDCWLFNDPCGYRQVFHADGHPSGLWCASQPGLLAEILKLAPDRDALNFIRAYRRREPQYWWPGDTSPYTQVHHLQPNHYLDLETGSCHRYWPDSDLAMRPVGDVVSENSRLLQALIESAYHRFELALSITSGMDTRLLLAASRKICDLLYCFTLTYWDLNRSSPDIQIPSKLLPRLGLAHHILQCPPRMNPKFRKIYRRNVSTAHEAYGTIAEGLYDHYPPSRVSMKGTAMVAACAYFRYKLEHLRPAALRGKIDVDILAWLTDREEKFAREAIDRWLSGVGETNVDTLELFYWEDREGNWQAMSQLELDIAQEVFVPFNCRRFLINTLSVPQSDRAPPTYALHEKLTQHLWPEVLSEPFNPPEDPTLITSSISLLADIRNKIVGTHRSTWTSDVQRAFQRLTWLTQLIRLSE